ncbi:O-antigen translocase [Halomarinibacterium sedimenti]|nr:O-antigen translocase [Halomarinibacterium sedimenti]
MTSLNAATIVIRLVVTFFVNREITDVISKGGYAKIGNLRNLIAQLTSFTSLGVFNGVVKYVAEHKENKEQLQKLFSTTFVFTTLGSIITFVALFFGASFFSEYYFNSSDFVYIIKLTAIVIPFISIQRVFSGVINGLSEYKSFAKIELVAYLVSAALTIVFLFYKELDGVLISIALAPVVQVLVMMFLVVKILREYVQFSQLKWQAPLAKSLFAFTIMSFFSTLLLNQVEIEIRNMIENKISEDEAGIWTGLMFISKNYMVFSNALLTLYVLPKFSGIYNKPDFMKELGSIYKTLLPLFAVGMFLVYLFRDVAIDLVFKGDYSAMSPLFRWQLLGDFIRLAAILLASQFIAKKMVYNFIFTEVLSLALFYGFAYYFVDIYGIEGVTIAHFLRYIIYFIVVFVLILRYFKKQNKKAQLK